MGNISNFNINKIDMRLSNVNYWDLYLAKEDATHEIHNTIISGDCLVAHYDFSNTGYTSTNNIHSLTTWEDGINNGFTGHTFGLTGIDNGQITFNKTSGDTANTALLSALTASTLAIASGDTRLVLNQVSGMTGDYIYPIDFVSNSGSTVGDYARLCGGFWQGYYKLDSYDYQVLPNRVPKGWVAEFWLRKRGENVVCSGYTGTTLNDDFSGNTGFFLYFGTRAENKLWNQFNGINTGSTSGCTSGASQWCTTIKETDISILDSSGITITLSPPPYDINVISNNFLIYDRTDSGKKAPDWQGKSITSVTISEEVTDTRNPFLIYNRSGKISNCSSGTGHTVNTYSGNTSPITELDKDADIIDNAIGFRVKPDGSIGYRRLVVTATCENNVTTTAVTVEESYSSSGVVSDDIWTMISIRWVADETLDDCELNWRPSRKGKLMFYINGKLKFIVKDFDEFIARRLSEHRDKQLTVPFNISLGGGSQGLLESMTFDGQDPNDLSSQIQNNFAGTFMGDISQFRFYICNLDYCKISNNFEQEEDRYTG